MEAQAFRSIIGNEKADKQVRQRSEANFKGLDPVVSYLPPMRKVFL